MENNGDINIVYICKNGSSQTFVQLIVFSSKIQSNWTKREYINIEKYKNKIYAMLVGERMPEDDRFPKTQKERSLPG